MGLSRCRVFGVGMKGLNRLKQPHRCMGNFPDIARRSSNRLIPSNGSSLILNPPHPPNVVPEISLTLDQICSIFVLFEVGFRSSLQLRLDNQISTSSTLQRALKFTRGKSAWARAAADSDGGGFERQWIRAEVDSSVGGE